MLLNHLLLQQIFTLIKSHLSVAFQSEICNYIARFLILDGFKLSRSFCKQQEQQPSPNPLWLANNCSSLFTSFHNCSPHPSCPRELQYLVSTSHKREVELLTQRLIHKRFLLYHFPTEHESGQLE